MASKVHERVFWHAGQVVGAGAPGSGGGGMERMRTGRVKKRMLVNFIVVVWVAYWVEAVEIGSRRRIDVLGDWQTEKDGGCIYAQNKL